LRRYIEPIGWVALALIAGAIGYWCGDPARASTAVHRSLPNGRRGHPAAFALWCVRRAWSARPASRPFARKHATGACVDAEVGATAVVQRGDTLYRIATRNGISVLDLAMWNNVPPPYTIYPGQSLRLYPSQRAGRPQSVAPSRRNRPRPATQAPPTAVATQPRCRAVASPFAWSWPADGTIARVTCR
jgi:hypothetical protein